LKKRTKKLLSIRGGMALAILNRLTDAIGPSFGSFSQRTA
jgi:hypothetical protein